MTESNEECDILPLSSARMALKPGLETNTDIWDNGSVDLSGPMTPVEDIISSERILVA